MKERWNTLKDHFGFAYFIRSRSVLLAIIGLGAFLRFYLLSGEYVHGDSYIQITGASEILRHGTFSYEYYGPPGPAIILTPFLLISETEFMAQMAIASLGVVLIISSYSLMKYICREKIAALVFALLVAINPTFILLSRVLLFENFLLLFFSFALLVTFVYIEKSNMRYTILLCTTFFVLMLIKTPSILMLPIAFICMTVAQGGVDFKKVIKGLLKRNTLIGVLFTSFLFAIYILVFPTEGKKFLTASRGSFSFIGLGLNAAPSLYILASPINTPATSVFFNSNFYQLNINWFHILVAPFQLWLLRRGVTLYSSTNKSYSRFLLTTLIVMALFYCTYLGWQARYLVISLYIELFYISIAITYAFKKLTSHGPEVKSAYIILVIVTMSIGVGFYHTISAVQAWNSEWSRFDTNVLVFREDTSTILELADMANVDLILTSYAPQFTFYTYRNENYSNLEIFDLYKYAVEHSVDDKSLQQLTLYVKDEINKGRRIWYVVGWPEIDDYNPNVGKGFQAFYYESIAKYFILKEIMIGRETVRNRDPAWREPSFYVFALSNETEPTDFHNFVTDLPASAAGHTFADLGLNATQVAYIHVTIPRSRRILITGIIDADCHIRAEGPVIGQTQLAGLVKKGETFEASLYLVSGQEYLITVWPIDKESTEYEITFTSLY